MAIDGNTIRKLRTALKEAKDVVARLERSLEEVQGIQPGWNSKDSKFRFMRWVAVYGRLALTLGLPAPFGGGWKMLKKWYAAGEALRANGMELPWEDEAVLEDALRKELSFHSGLCFEWLCGSTKEGAPNIRGVLLRAQENQTSELPRKRPRAEDSPL